MKMSVVSFALAGTILFAVGVLILNVILPGPDQQENTFRFEDRFLAIEQRLTVFETSIDEIRRSVEELRNHTSEAEEQPVSMKEWRNEYLEGIEALEKEIAELRNNLVAAFDSVSPISPLDSAEEELARAELFYETKKWNTAANAYVRLLERYPRHPQAPAIAKKALKSYRPNGDPAILPAIEEMLRRYPSDDVLRCLCNVGQHYSNRQDYADAVRVLKKIIATGPDNGLKLRAYWVMAFAVRETEGENAFVETLRDGRDLAITLDERMEEFEREISTPRPGKPRRWTPWKKQ